MTLHWRDAAGTSRKAGNMRLRTENGVDAGDLKLVRQIYLRTANGTNPADLKLSFVAGLSLAVTPSAANGFSSNKSGPITSNLVVVGVAYGRLPYTHSWVATAGITVNSPSSPITSFTATPPTFEGEVTGSATDTVTDADGLSNTITVPIDIVRSH